MQRRFMKIEKRRDTSRDVFYEFDFDEEKKSKNLIIHGMGATCGLLAVFLVLFITWVRDRVRSATNASVIKDKRIVIIGAGSAGSTAAATLTQQNPDAEVVVMEYRREQVFTALGPQACAGHRSYDVRTSAPNWLYCNTSWSVTRDAELIVGTADRVDPKRSVVIDDKGKEISYDILVMAVGAENNYDIGVKGLSSETIDKNRVAAHTYSVRDNLVSSADGDILIVRVNSSRDVEKLNHRAKGEGSIERMEDYYERNYEPYFFGTANLIWKYTQFWGRFLRVVPITSDNTLSDALPSVYQETLDKHFEFRRQPYRTGMALVGIDMENREATFMDASEATLRIHKTPQFEQVKYRFMMLHPPLKGPEIIKKSGLDAPNTAGFVNVDPITLQHKDYKNVFALGDCAALPTSRSYGAVFAQVPVLTQNIGRLLRPQDNEPLARYDGYTSFVTMMNTYKAMWPEYKYGRERVDNHLWDNSAHTGFRGWANAMFVSFALYENFHWFVALRGLWYPPKWFMWPTFSLDQSGTVIEPKVEA